jgi:hypothetical protein
MILDGKPIPVDMSGQTDMGRVLVSGALSVLDNMSLVIMFSVIVKDTLAGPKTRSQLGLFSSRW